jgi:hypothetical protein
MKSGHPIEESVAIIVVIQGHSLLLHDINGANGISEFVKGLEQQ